MKTEIKTREELIVVENENSKIIYPGERNPDAKTISEDMGIGEEVTEEAHKVWVQSLEECENLGELANDMEQKLTKKELCYVVASLSGKLNKIARNMENLQAIARISALMGG